jgi:AcrR family transcriptional regulator
MPKAFTESEKKIIRERLVETGFRLFSAYGLKKTNIEELAAGAGISKGAFYIFYKSKEALFMDVAELAEGRFRREILSAIDLLGPSPRARLVFILKKAFSFFNTIPILRFISGSDYDLLFRRIPAEKLQEHLAHDRLFFDELITRCQQAGIPIQVPSEEMSGLLYTLFLTRVHEGDLGANHFRGTLDLLLELVAAYCLGEVVIPTQTTSLPEER